LTELVFVDGEDKVEVNPKAFTTDSEVFLEVTSQNDEKIYTKVTITDICKPYPIKFKDDLELEFSVFKGGSDTKLSDSTWKEMIVDQKNCMKSAKIVKDENGAANELADLVKVDDAHNIEVSEAGFTEDSEVFLEVTSKSGDKIYTKVTITEKCPRDKLSLTDSESKIAIKAISGDPED
jgi:hypothetical protein